MLCLGISGFGKDADVTFNADTTGSIGGYVGAAEKSATLTNMKGLQITNFTTSAENNTVFGGIVGNLTKGGTLTSCVSQGTGSGSFNLDIENKGGLVGKYSDGKLTFNNCTNNISIYSRAGSVGGFVATTGGSLEFSGANTNNGAITRTPDGTGNKMAGGFVGDITDVTVTTLGSITNNGMVLASADTSAISKFSAFAGGFAGRYSATQAINGVRSDGDVTATKVPFEASDRLLPLSTVLSYGYAAAGGVVGYKTTNASVADCERGIGKVRITDSTITDLNGNINAFAWRTDNNYADRPGYYWIENIFIEELGWVNSYFYLSNSYITGFMGLKVGRSDGGIDKNSGVTRFRGGKTWGWNDYGGISWKNTLGGHYWSGYPSPFDTYISASDEIARNNFYEHLSKSGIDINWNALHSGERPDQSNTDWERNYIAYDNVGFASSSVGGKLG